MATNDQLEAKITVLRDELNNLTAEVKKIKVEPILDVDKLVYQQAADWVRMVNTITWTLGSIYLVGAIIALNSAIGPSISQSWRTIIGCGVAFLCLLWALTDAIYWGSSSSARKILLDIERKWGAQKFYTRQSEGWLSTWRGVVNVLVYVTMLVPGYLGLVVAKPDLPPWIAQIVIFDAKLTVSK